MKTTVKAFMTALAVFAMAALVGCAHAPAGMSPSTKPVRLDAKVLGHSTGQSQYMSIFAVIPMGTPDYDAAIKDAIKKVPGGNAMINVTAYQTMIYLWVVSINQLTVEGDVVKD